MNGSTRKSKWNKMLHENKWNEKKNNSTIPFGSSKSGLKKEVYSNTGLAQAAGKIWSK